jgi:hypothetical protein
MAIRKPNNAESFREQLRKNGLFEPDKSVPKQEPPKTLCVVSPQVGGHIMGFGRGALLWLIGVPLPIVLLLALFMHH